MTDINLRVPHPPPRPASRTDAPMSSQSTLDASSTPRQLGLGSSATTSSSLMQKAIQRVKERQAAGIYSANLSEFAPTNVVMLKDLLSPSPRRRSSQSDPMSAMETRRAAMAASSPTRARAGSVASVNASPQSAALSPLGTPLFAGAGPSADNSISNVKGMSAGPRPPPFRGTEVIMLGEEEMKQHSGYGSDWVTRVAYQQALLKKHRSLQTLRKVYVPINKLPIEERARRRDVEAMECQARLYIAQLYDRRTHDMWHGRLVRDTIRKQDKEVIERYSKSRLVVLPTPKQKDRPFYGPKSPLWKEHGRTDRRRSSNRQRSTVTLSINDPHNYNSKPDELTNFVVNEGGKSVESERSTPCAISSNSNARTSSPTSSQSPLGTSYRTAGGVDVPDFQQQSKSTLSLPSPLGRKSSTNFLASAKRNGDVSNTNEKDVLQHRSSILSAAGSATLAPNSSLTGLDPDAIRMRVGSTYLSRYSSESFVHEEGSGKYQPSAFEARLAKK